MNLIAGLNWRHAVKAYDSTKKVSKEHIDKIIEAARLAPTSSGLQPFKIIVVENKELKEKLMEGALNPDCMKDCSHVLIFAGWNRYTPERIDKVYDYITDERGLERGRFGSYTAKIKELYDAQSAEENFAHIARQTYIALGVALSQAAELRVDTTPIEGFDNKLVDEILELDKLGLKSVSLMYVGYADKTKDWVGSMKKVRIPTNEFIVEYK